MNQNKEESKEWQIYALEVCADNASKKIAKFFEQEFGGVKRVKLDLYDFQHKEELIKKVRDSLEKQEGKKILSVYGSNDFHHLTYGLFSFACKEDGKKYGYIHFDKHNDTEPAVFNPELCCGDFVGPLSKDMNADVLRIGNRKYNREYIDGGHQGIDCKKIHNAMENGDLEGLIKKELSNFPNDVYLSFDLDVMDQDEIITHYRQGTLKSSELLKIIDVIQKEKNIVGADILGLSEGCKRVKKEKGMRLYSAIASKLLDEETKAKGIPPYIVSEEEIDKAVSIINSVL